MILFQAIPKNNNSTGHTPQKGSAGSRPWRQGGETFFALARRCQVVSSRRSAAFAAILEATVEDFTVFPWFPGGFLGFEWIFQVVFWVSGGLLGFGMGLQREGSAFLRFFLVVAGESWVLRCVQGFMAGSFAVCLVLLVWRKRCSALAHFDFRYASQTARCHLRRDSFFPFRPFRLLCLKALATLCLGFPGLCREFSVCFLWVFCAVFWGPGRFWTFSVRLRGFSACGFLVISWVFQRLLGGSFLCLFPVSFLSVISGFLGVL